MTPTTRRQNIIRKPAMAANSEAMGIKASGPMYTVQSPLMLRAGSLARRVHAAGPRIPAQPLVWFPGLITQGRAICC